MIVVDIETSGLNPRRHSILSIGAIDLFDPGEQFYEECRLIEGAKVNPRALDINGFDEEEIRDDDKSSVKEILEKFFSWAHRSEDLTLAGQHVQFDSEFLKTAAHRHGMVWIFGHRYVDLHTTCYLHILKENKVILDEDRKSQLDLDRILKYVGLPEREGSHNALNDAKLEAEAFHRLIWKKALLDDYKKHEVPSHLKSE